MKDQVCEFRDHLSKWGLVKGKVKGRAAWRGKKNRWTSRVWFGKKQCKLIFALKTFTGLSTGLIIPYFYYFHHALIYKAHGCGTVQVWLSSLSLNFSHAASGTKGMMSWWFSWPCPARLMVVPSTEGSVLTMQGAEFTEQTHNFTLLKYLSTLLEYLNSMQLSSQCSHLSLMTYVLWRGWAGGGKVGLHLFSQIAGSKTRGNCFKFHRERFRLDCRKDFLHWRWWSGIGTGCQGKWYNCQVWKCSKKSVDVAFKGCGLVVNMAVLG